MFLDEALHNCRSIHEALDSHNVQYVRHGAKFQAGVLDTEWLPVVGKEGWAVLTADKRIRFNQLEVSQVIRHGVRQFVFSSGNLNGAMMGDILKIAMPRMQEIFYVQEAPFIAGITQSGNVEVRFDQNGPVHRRKKPLS